MDLEIFEAARHFVATQEGFDKISAQYHAAIKSKHEAQDDLEKLMNALGPDETIAIRLPELATVLICDWDYEEGFINFRTVKFFDGDGCISDEPARQRPLYEGIPFSE